MNDDLTEEWFSLSGFKWRQEERQPSKHWMLSLGYAIPDATVPGVGIELASQTHKNRFDEEIGNPEKYFCWITDSNLNRSIHTRYLSKKSEVIQLVEAITGQKWNLDNHLYGNVYTPEMAKQITTNRP